MIIVFCIIGILFCLFCDFRIIRNLASPLFLAGGIWLMQYIILLIFMPSFFSENVLTVVFFLCFLTFFFGFLVFTSRGVFEKKVFLPQYGWNAPVRIPLIVSTYVFSAVTIAKCWNELNVRSASIWRTMIYCMNETDLFESGISVLFLNLIPIIFLVAFALYAYNPIRENRNILLLLFPPLLSVLLFSPRGGWFFLLISVAYIYIFVKSISNKKIFFSALIMLAMFFVIWGCSSLDKFSTSYSYMSDFEKLRHLFSSYFIGSSQNLFYLIENFDDFGNGKYTFRFFCAVLAHLFDEIEVVDTISPFIYVNGIRTNVYTAVGWVYRDFGLGWAFFVFGCLGLFYGFLYKKMMETKDIFFVIVAAVMMTPIAYFFFDDMLFSRFSLWLQRVVFVFVLTGPVFLVKRS